MSKNNPTNLKYSIYTITDNTTSNYKGIFKWINDNGVTSCHNCCKKFTTFNRKHHCRFCGKIFCNICSNKYRIIPSTILNDMSLKNKSVRVCGDCCKLIDLHLFVEQRFMYLKYLSLKDIKTTIIYVCKLWHQVGLYYMSLINNSQYKLLIEPLTENEKDLLMINREYLNGHSKYMMQMYRFDNVIQYDKKYNCKLLNCDNNCKNKLSNEQIIQIIFFLANNNKSITHLLIQLNLTYTEYTVYLSLLIHIFQLHYDIDIFNFFIKYSKINIDFYKITIWEFLSVNMNEYAKDLSKNMEEDKIYNFVLASHNLFVQLKNCHDVISIFNKMYECKDLYIPNINDTFVKIDFSKIIIKSSKNAPIIIPFIFKNKQGKEYVKKYMLKNSNIYQEYTIVKIFALMLFFLKSNNIINDTFIIYNIYPITNDFGIIEIIDESETLYNIKHKYNKSILNYILENNTENTINATRKLFINNLALWSIMTYLLGIGDRHLDNIMLHKSGIIFHIDFDFILGNDPKMAPTTMRITDEMLDAIGGKGGSNYLEFKNMCSKIFDHLRIYINIFAIMLLTIHNKDKILKELKSRFEPGEKYLDASSRMSTIVDNSSNHIWFNMIDGMHLMAKNLIFA